MRLGKLTIHNFKNLKDFSIDFDERSLTTVLVGQNGTGKFNRRVAEAQRGGAATKEDGG